MSDRCTADERAAAIAALRQIANALEADPRLGATGTITATRWLPPTEQDVAEFRTDMRERSTTITLDL